MKIIARDPLATLRRGDDIDMEVGWLVGGGCCDSCCRCRCVSAGVFFFWKGGGLVVWLTVRVSTLISNGWTRVFVLF